MSDVYFKCGNGFFEGHPKFLSCHHWREAAADISRFAVVLFTAEPFLKETVVSVTLDVENDKVFISGTDSILASRNFEDWPDEGELTKMLFDMLAEIVE